MRLQLDPREPENPPPSGGAADGVGWGGGGGGGGSDGDSCIPPKLSPTGALGRGGESILHFEG